MERTIKSSIWELEREIEKNEILLQSLDGDAPVKSNCTPDDTMNKDVHSCIELYVIAWKVN